MAETLGEVLASNQQDWHKGEDTVLWPSSQLPAKDPAILYSSGDTVSFIWQLMNGIIFKAKMILQVISPSNYQSHYLFIFLFLYPNQSFLSLPSFSVSSPHQLNLIKKVFFQYLFCTRIVRSITALGAHLQIHVELLYMLGSHLVFQHKIWQLLEVPRS